MKETWVTTGAARNCRPLKVKQFPLGYFLSSGALLALRNKANHFQKAKFCSAPRLGKASCICNPECLSNFEDKEVRILMDRAKFSAFIRGKWWTSGLHLRLWMTTWRIRVKNRIDLTNITIRLYPISCYCRIKRLIEESVCLHKRHNSLLSRKHHLNLLLHLYKY